MGAKVLLGYSGCWKACQGEQRDASAALQHHRGRKVMTSADLESFLTMSRKKTLELLEAIAKQPQQAAILSWRPGPGRAHIGWQLMHIAATDDRHLMVR